MTSTTIRTEDNDEQRPSNTPPGAPPPGYPPGVILPTTPRIQWRIYREQQKAPGVPSVRPCAPQRYAARAGYYGGVYAPRVPSVVGPIVLIGVGVIAFLVITDRIEASQFWTWYAHWWPLLLIGAGLALLGEWALDARRKTPVRLAAASSAAHSARLPWPGRRRVGSLVGSAARPVRQPGR